MVTREEIREDFKLVLVQTVPPIVTDIIVRHIDEFAAIVKRAFDDVYARLDRLDAQYEALDTRLGLFEEKTDTHFDTLEARLGSFEEKTETRFDTLEEKMDLGFKTVHTRVDRLALKVGAKEGVRG